MSSSQPPPAHQAKPQNTSKDTQSRAQGDLELVTGLLAGVNQLSKPALWGRLVGTGSEHRTPLEMEQPAAPRSALALPKGDQRPHLCCLESRRGGSTV